MSKSTVGRWILFVATISFSACTGRASTVDPIRITAAGSTFAYPLYVKWAYSFAKLHPNVQIDYQPLGSGAGIGLVTDGRVDFGATDGPMTDDQLKTFAERRGFNVLHIPVALGAAVPSYNVAGVSGELKFTASALAGIFLGTITKWNDPQLGSANPGIALPNADIVVVHRDDRSGTTFVWTDFLSKTSDEWREKVGRDTSVKWPVGAGAKGNQGVAEMIKATPNALGYVELTYAIQEKLTYGQVRNSSGQFVRANLESVTAAAADSVATMPADFRVSITNPASEHAYPVSSFTWALVPSKIEDPVKRQTVIEFLSWGLAEGQLQIAPLSYARLPEIIVEKAKPLLGQVQ